MDPQELMRRRLERERSARRQAERLLEDKSRELYEAKENLQHQYNDLIKRNATIDLLNSIADFAKRRVELLPSLQGFLDAVCDAAGWPVGHIYVPDPREEMILMPLDLWHVDNSSAFAEFRRVTLQTKFRKGEGLPGRILASGEPAWIEDVHRDDNFPRARTHGGIEVHGAFGVPIYVFGKLTAIAEFYHDQPRPVDAWLLATVHTTARQLGALLERSEAEESLHELNRQLSQRNEEMQQFIYAMSHDMKAPLVTLSNFTVMLEEDLAAGRSEMALHALPAIRKAADRMAELIQDVLQLSRIGRVDDPWQTVSLATLIDELLRDLQVHIKEAAAQIQVQSELPVLYFQRSAMYEVMENLLTNALKYGRLDGRCEIEIGSRLRDAEVQLFVRDRGPGISAEFHQKIFQPFQRLSADDRGTGIGLAIVDRVARSNQGRCWVESIPPSGATFWFALPATLLRPDARFSSDADQKSKAP